MRLPSALVLVALLGPSVHVLTGQASPRRPRPTLTPCRVPGLAQAVTCGTLDVLENRRAASGRKIGIHFKVLRATGTLRATEAIFNFAGGPGGAASEALGGLAEDLKELRKTRDLVAVDIRGTGLSAPLDCPNLGGEGGAQRFLDEFMPASEVAVCRRQLEKSHDLRLYNTPLAMDDVEAVRAALGYTQVDLIGESYGTRSALVYMRQYPAHVRAAVMEGLVPTSARLPLTFAYDAQASLDQVLAACAAEAACHQAFPDPAGDLRRALDATAAAPAQVALTDLSTRQPMVLRLGPSGLAQALRYMLYSPTTHPLIPAYLHEAARGNIRPFAEVAQSFAGFLGGGEGDGYFLSVTCSEDVRFYTPEEAAKAASGTFLGDFRARKQKEACAEWPVGEVPAGYADAVRSAAPTLIVSGERDPVTPAPWAVAMMRTLPNGLHLIVPGAGHGTGGLQGTECLDRLEVAFLRAGSSAGLDTSCVSRIHAQPFVTRLMPDTAVAIAASDLAPLAGTYAKPDASVTIIVALSADHLTLEMSGEKPLRLAPVGGLRFKVEGVPPGFVLTFEHQDASSIAATLVEGLGATPQHFVRTIAQDSGAAPISADAVRKHVMVLADDSLEGRGAGYRGERKAAEYIAEQFRAIGLLPYGDVVKGKRSYLQAFRFHPQEPPKPWDVFTSRNVVGFLEGRDSALKAEIVVVGAHFDGQGRLGQANPDRLMPDGELKHDIWNSADDNASSVAALIEMARSLSRNRPRRSVLFMAFSAEEYALNGSIRYVTAPSLRWSRHVAMINLEKLGKIPNQSLITASSSTSPMWDDVTARANALTGQKVESAIADIISDTDHYPFAALGVPGITIGMAHQEDTHLPSDTPDRIAYDALAQRATYALRFVTLVADLDTRPRFTGKLGRDLGLLVLIPSEAERNVDHAVDALGALKVSALIPGLPAARAHLREGDLIVAVDGHPLVSTAHRKGAVQKAADEAAGQSIEVTLVRNKQQIRRRIVLPDRVQ